MKKVKYTEFVKAHPQMVVLHVQPEVVEIVETPQELKDWEQFMIKEIGLQCETEGTTVTQTRCSDSGGLRDYPCDSDLTH